MLAHTRRLGLIRPPSFTCSPDSLSDVPGSQLGAMYSCRSVLCHSEGAGVSIFVREQDVEPKRRGLAHLAEVAPGEAARASVYPVPALPAELQDGRYLALHDFSGPWLDAVSYARGALGSQLTPVTCTGYGFCYQEWLRAFLARLLLVPTYPCDAVITTTRVARQAMTNIIERLRGEIEGAPGLAKQQGFQISVIPRGVPVDLFKPRDRADVRRLLELPADKTILLYVGRIDPASKMDPAPLLLAFRQLVERHGDGLRLVLAGQAGPYSEALGAAIRQLGLARSVIHRANLPYVSIPLYYSAADIFVSLSDTLQENFGLTPVEAMASGLPVVVSDWAGYRETVIHGETGFKVPTSWAGCDADLCLLAPFHEWTDDALYSAQSVAVDIHATVGYLDVLIRDRCLRLEMGANARQHAVDSFSLERCAKLHWSLWRELSAVAEQLPARSPAHPAFLRPRYFEDFRGFAALEVGTETRIELTERGRLACRGKERLTPVGDIRGLLNARLLAKILRVVRLWMFMRQRVSIAQIESLLNGRHADPSITRRHIMWLLKYDLLCIEGSRTRGPGPAAGRPRNGAQEREHALSPPCAAGPVPPSTGAAPSAPAIELPAGVRTVPRATHGTPIEGDAP